MPIYTEKLRIYYNSKEKLQLGTFVKGKVIDVSNYDLIVEES